ncbi:MAG: HAMP domain-containing sensor histidine kinase [Phenylobacterium sp.]
MAAQEPKVGSSPMPPAARPITVSAPAEAAARLRRETAFEARKHSFLRMVSHELRTPLNSILGFSEILASELYGPLGAPQYREYAEIIRGSGQKLLKLVNQVLEIARLEAGDAFLFVQAEPIGPAIDDALAGLADAATARGIRLVRGPEAIQVLADPRGLRAVLANLIQNAVAFSPEGGEIRIRAERTGRTAEIVIEDDGEGVDPADLPRLLQPFEQGGNALNRHTEGAGLGLAICDLTCQAMGGRLQLSCEPGQGLRARVRLRCA